MTMSLKTSGKFLRTPPLKRSGTCELCGGHGRKLGVLAVGDFIGYACEQCIRELAQGLPRRHIPPNEETEPSE